MEMGIYDDGPYEVGDENRLDPDLVPVPANSYLGGFELCVINIACICKIHVCCCFISFNVHLLLFKLTINMERQYGFTAV